jgi:endoglucanase
MPSLALRPPRPRSRPLAIALLTGSLLLGGLVTAPEAAAATSAVRVNQVGYLPDGPKRATIVTTSSQALTWQLRNASGTVVASGSTTPRGADTPSGQTVHIADFSSYRTAGTGYVLTVDGSTSPRFDIRANLYDQLRSDAMAFFYHQRSGIPIEASLVGSQYARPAGHLGVAPNKGDTSVPCQAGVCDYSLDVRGGWYDAGDHGKYVVNGGLSTWLVVNSFERAKRSGTERAQGDSTLRVPERGNGVPDVLDEARWELEFLLRMQVPAGRQYAGMAFHKIHDANWTALPTRPEQDAEQRELHRPSTAATLNLAATAAQAARVYRPYDADFADRCLEAARRAWTAAQANPSMLAPATDSNGGGAYEDNRVTDEFYWAAAELYATTGESTYRDAVTSSPWHTSPDAFHGYGFGWQDTAALGRLTLATVPNGLPSSEISRIRSSVTAAADAHLNRMAAQGYAVPLPQDGYFWGSNGAVANNAIVLAVAAELTGDARYRNGALEVLDYLLGRNALGQSYVTGYGEKDSRNQHHRFWARQADPSLPNPPAGSIAGGPNSGLQDPVAEARLRGCAPAACYIDDIESYSTNEVAINWNAPLAWIAAYAADQGGTGDGQDPGGEDPGGEDPGDPPVTGTCDVTYKVDNAWNDGFTASVTIRNTSESRIDGWELTWSWPGSQRVTNAWNAQVTQSGSAVTARAVDWNRQIAPGASVSFGFQGSGNGNASSPSAFKLNGSACD